MLNLTNAIRDSIKPDVTLFTTCETEMIKETYGENYEEIRYLNQELSFTTMKKELSISQPMAVKLLKSLLIKSVIIKFGEGKNTRYKLK